MSLETEAYASCGEVPSGKRTTGYFNIQGTQVYCDFSTTSGGVWQLPLIKFDRTSMGNIGNIADYRTLCAQHGFFNAGKGAESVEAWRAAKNMLHASDHALERDSFPHGGANLIMPVVKDGSSDQTLYTINDGTTVANIPSNQLGDHCNGSSGEIYC